MGDPGKLGVSTPALLYKMYRSPTRTGMFVLFLNVYDLQAFEMNLDGEGEFAYG